MRPSRTFAALLLAITSVAAHAQPEPGISRALAQARAARLSDIRYALSFTLAPKSPTTSATETLTFTDSGRGDLPLDFRDGHLQSATLNTKQIPLALQNGHLILPAAALAHGPNKLEVAFTANIAAVGKAITRYEDKDDGSEYLYTLFVPADADMAFPCFDQPDLKARFTVAIGHPTSWKVISNTAATHTTSSGASSQTIFAETQPISTYLFAFAAGPFARLTSFNPKEPTVYVRASQLTRAQQEAPEVQAIAAQGIAYLSDYFQQSFPFAKYDLVLIPGFPFGGMEHAGATFLNEDGVLFRSTPTASDYFRRDILVLHETTHQWFGDFVTMRWFDDLWLKEGFAQYMAYKAMAQLKPQTQPWKHFNEDIKPLAYAIDETQGTTPIFQNIPNLKDAKSAYGAIVYQKAPAMLKQLDFRLGNDTFRDGLRLYLKQHAYANATWPNLIHAFDEVMERGQEATPGAARGPSPLHVWADAWITHRGMPQIDTAIACEDGHLTSLTLTQHDVLGTDFIWPITNDVLVDFGGGVPNLLPPLPDGGYDGRLSTGIVLKQSWNTRSVTVDVPHSLGAPPLCPSLVFANLGDQAYGRFLLDASSLHLLAPELITSLPLIAQIKDPLLRSQLYTAEWENVRTTRTAPANYVELALWGLDDEQDESLNRIQGARIVKAFHDYMPRPGKLQAIAYAEVRRKMLEAPSLDLRIVNFHTFVPLANQPHAWSDLTALLDGKLTLPGFELKLIDRWSIVSQLIASGSPEASARFQAEQARNTSGEAKKYAYAAQAATPDLAIKARYFADYQSTKVQEDWLTQSLRPFNSYNQQLLTLPYLQQALNQLPEIKRNRKIFFLGAWLSAFLDGQSTPEAQDLVHQWLAQPSIDPDLRLKVLEVSDALDRTVAIRQKYPDQQR